MNRRRGALHGRTCLRRQQEENVSKKAQAESESFLPCLSALAARCPLSLFPGAQGTCGSSPWDGSLIEAGSSAQEQITAPPNSPQPHVLSELQSAWSAPTPSWPLALTQVWMMLPAAHLNLSALELACTWAASGKAGQRRTGRGAAPGRGSPQPRARAGFCSTQLEG